MQPDLLMMSTRGFQRKGQTGRGGQSRRCVQQSAIQTSAGTPCAIWRQPGERKGCHATWKLDLHVPTIDNWDFHKAPPCPLVLYNVYTKGLADLNSNGLSHLLTLAVDMLFYKIANDIHTAVTAVQEQLKNCRIGAKRQSPKTIQARHKPCGAPSATKQ